VNCLVSFEKSKELVVLGEDEYDLIESYKALGPLVPILKDVNGNVIDGLHRQQIDPNWPSITVNTVKDRVQLLVTRLVSNVCRRRMKDEEKTQILSEIAELTKWTPKEIAQFTGASYQWVTKYLPKEYKDATKVEAGKLGGEALRQAYKSAALQNRPKSQDIRFREPPKPSMKEVNKVARSLQLFETYYPTEILDVAAQQNPNPDSWKPFIQRFLRILFEVAWANPKIRSEVEARLNA
jgi:hypothetical protein